MASGGYYVLTDSTESITFPAPVTAWPEQVLGDGLDGVPVFNAYRIHTWAWTSLPEDYLQKLAAFQTRQQAGTLLTTIETDEYDPADDCVQYRTVEYTDVRIKNLNRERGYGVYNSPTMTFEILVV